MSAFMYVCKYVRSYIYIYVFIIYIYISMRDTVCVMVLIITKYGALVELYLMRN